jgi:hypothetical protein
MFCFIIFSTLTYFFLVLHQFSNCRLEWDYTFIMDMQNGGVNNVIPDMHMFLCREIFHIEGTFFDKNETLAKFPQLCTYERYVV